MYVVWSYVNLLSMSNNHKPSLFIVLACLSWYKNSNTTVVSNESTLSTSTSVIEVFSVSESAMNRKPLGDNSSKQSIDKIVRDLLLFMSLAKSWAYSSVNLI